MRILLVLAIMFIALPAFAEPKLEINVHRLDVVTMRKGLEAPFSGLLVPEPRFVQFLEAEIRIKELEGELKLERRLRLTQEQIYTDVLKETSKPKTWWNSPGTQRLVGFGAGIVAASLAIYGGAQLAKASQ